MDQGDRARDGDSDRHLLRRHDLASDPCRGVGIAESSRAINPACLALFTSSAMFAARVAPPVSSATLWSRNGVIALPRIRRTSASVVARSIAVSASADGNADSSGTGTTM